MLEPIYYQLKKHGSFKAIPPCNIGYIFYKDFIFNIGIIFSIQVSLSIQVYFQYSLANVCYALLNIGYILLNVGYII